MNPTAENGKRETVSLVVPVYNERGNIPLLVEALRAMRLPPPYELLEVLIVDDGSTDGTEEAVQAHLGALPGLRLIQLERNFGQTSALSAGFHFASGEIVVCLDGDLQNDPADIALLLGKLSEGHDVVSGWRKDRQDPWLRTQLSKVANYFIGRVTSLALHDYGCTLKAYRRKYLSKIHLYGEMHRFIPVYLRTVGARVCEIPVRHRPRSWGTSKYGFNRTFKVVLDLMVIHFLNKYSNRPIYLFGSAGFLSLAASFIFGFYALYLKFFDATDLIRTPLPSISLLSLFTGVLFILLGLLAEILMRVYYESQHKPTYLIRRILPEA